MTYAAREYYVSAVKGGVYDRASVTWYCGYEDAYEDALKDARTRRAHIRKHGGRSILINLCAERDPFIDASDEGFIVRRDTVVEVGPGRLVL